jgi:hypothetical protein
LAVSLHEELKNTAKILPKIKLSKTKLTKIKPTYLHCKNKL